jgi:hypothetical protein
MPFIAVFSTYIAVFLIQRAKTTIIAVWKRQHNQTTQTQRKSLTNATEDCILSVSRNKKDYAVKSALNISMSGEKIILSTVVSTEKNTVKRSAVIVRSTAGNVDSSYGCKLLSFWGESALGAALVIGAASKSIISMVGGIKNVNKQFPWIGTIEICSSRQKSIRYFVLTAIRSSDTRKRNGGIPTSSILFALRQVGPDSLTNACQVFESQCLASTNGFVDKGLGYAMVDIFLKALFASRELPQTAFGRASTHALQRLTPLVIVHADFMDFGTAKGLPSAIGGKIDDPQVNTQRFRGLCDLGSLCMLCHMQIVDAPSPDQVSTADLPRRVYQHIMLPLAWKKATGNTTLDGVERHPIKGEQAKGANIIAHTATWLELWAGNRFRIRLALLFLSTRNLDRFHGLGTCAHGKLSAQVKARTSLTVHPMMGSVSVGDTLLPADSSNPCSRRIETLLCLLQYGFMLADIQLDANSSYEHFVHKRSIAEDGTKVQGGGLSRLFFLPAPKGGGIQTEGLMIVLEPVLLWKKHSNTLIRNR